MQVGAKWSFVVAEREARLLAQPGRPTRVIVNHSTAAGEPAKHY